MRADSTNNRDVLDEGESCDLDMQEDLELALIQMNADTLTKVTDAARRLDEGAYGHCLECGEEIAGARLRALPFAVRCRDCEEARERVEDQERIVTRRGPSTRLSPMSN